MTGTRPIRCFVAASLLLCLLLPALLPAQRSGPERDAWQRPQEVMDALAIGPGDAVADVGSGRGYFTFHLAERVGPQGMVYAVDIAEEDLKKLRNRAEREGIRNIETIRNVPDDPRLPPACCDAVLVVDAYHEFRQYDAMLERIFEALKPGGRLGIIDGKIEPGRRRSHYHRRHRIPAELVREDAARHGFVFLGERPGFTRPSDNKQFWFLIFQKPVP
ncbi:class I SAM-dependent methyltransferase [Acidobacteriia bacterium AH_259_A11_L15]|nr:class I SAM-dependent methyltransferase [Acidobacteriia bacterium AH_259_A11_L15]